MSFLDGIIDNIEDFAAEHGVTADKIKEVKEMIEDKVDDINIAEIAEKVGVPESLVEKLTKKEDKAK